MRVDARFVKFQGEWVVAVKRADLLDVQTREKAYVRKSDGAHEWVAIGRIVNRTDTEVYFSISHENERADG